MGKKENEKLAAILSYLLIGIIWYFADDKMRKSAFVKYHVIQALNLIIISIVIDVVLTILMFTIFIIPLVNLIIFILAILGIINAANMKKKPVPIIGEFAKKYLKF